MRKGDQKAAPVRADSLLLWMSARGSGSWQQFRAAVEELHLAETAGDSSAQSDDTGAYGLPLYQLLRLNVQRLGHAEFFCGAREADWRIVPPVLAISRLGSDALGVLVGARWPGLMRRVEAECDGRLQASSTDDYPTQFIVRGSVRELSSIAERSGLMTQRDAPRLMLLSLPAVDDIVTFRRAELPIGAAWTVERFSASTLGWKPASQNEAIAGTGLFRFSFRHERRIFLCTPGLPREVGAQTGKYNMLHRRRRRVFEYDRQTGTVTVRPSCRPPFLIERALILCSGLPPSFDVAKGQLVYGTVPENIARLAAQLLRQDF
jgi:hypothetical protein